MCSSDTVCVVCWNETTSCLGPCGHRLCPACAVTWCKNNPTCPYCRRDTSGLQDWNPPASKKNLKVRFPSGSAPGITVCNRGVKDGVDVWKINPKDRCAVDGLRRGMVIEALNGVPCTRHDVVVRMMEAAKDSGAHVVLQIQTPPKGFKQWAKTRLLRIFA